MILDLGDRSTGVRENFGLQVYGVYGIINHVLGKACRNSDACVAAGDIYCEKLANQARKGADELSFHVRA